MKKILFFTVTCLLCYFSSQAQNDPQIIPGEYIVSIKTTSVQPLLAEVAASDGDREARYAENNTARQQKLDQLRTLRTRAGIAEQQVLFDSVDAVVAFGVKLTPEQLNALKQANEVEQIENNFTIQLETPVEEANEPDLPAGQNTPCAITNAGGSVSGEAKNTYIWILDTGIDTDHPDLNVVTAAPYAKSFVTGQTVEDGHGHGTHVAGIAAAKDNNIGIIGMSAGAKVVPLKVLGNTGAGNTASIISALNHVAQLYKVNDAVNLSLASTVLTNCENSSIAYRNAIRNLGLKGVWVCIAAGNESCDAAKSRPSCINGTNILTVGGMTCAKKCMAMSNWNMTVVDWVATGDKVYSTYKNGTYKTLSGTSMATPVVAGLCHSKGGAPVSGGAIYCGNSCVVTAEYKIAKRQ